MGSDTPTKSVKKWRQKRIRAHNKQHTRQTSFSLLVLGVFAAARFSNVD